MSVLTNALVLSVKKFHIKPQNYHGKKCFSNESAECCHSIIADDSLGFKNQESELDKDATEIHPT